MAINIKDAEEKLGKEKIEELKKKEWKKAELPSEEELAQEEHKSPKARNNPNSRKNLIQYREKTPEQKEKMLQNLKFQEKEEDVNPHDIIEGFEKIGAIEKIMPALDVLVNRREQEIYYNYIALILSDFEVEDLTGSDLDDIVTLAINRVLEYRLLSVGSKNPKLVMEAGTTLEKFRKFSEKIKSGLASRRVDRIDVKNKPAFSIVDLAGQLDEQNKRDLEKRLQALEEKKEEYRPPVRNEDGYIVDDDPEG